MTTFAYKDGILAVDSQATTYNLISDQNTVKAFVIPGEKFTITSDGEGGELTTKEKRLYGRLSGYLFIGTGSLSQVQGFADYLRRIDDKFEVDDRSAYEGAPEFWESNAMLLPPALDMPAVLFYGQSLIIRKIDEDTLFADGSGSELAIGAMEFGASAQEAVSVAIKRDAFSGYPIRGYMIEDGSWVELEDVDGPDGFTQDDT